MKRLVTALFILALPVTASAQQPPPLPPPTPPPPGSEPPPSPTYPPQDPNPPPTYYQQPPPPPQHPRHRPFLPPPYEFVEPEPPPHAPRFSLWTGARVGLLSFSNAFYTNSDGHAETTGNFARTGLSVEADVGARLAKRFLPYVLYEHGFMGQGRRFEGSDATSQSNLYGIGFRYTAFDVDSVGFLTDLSFGFRSITVSNGSESYTMRGLEIFRFGLGAEIRINTLFVISPLLSISSGAMNDTDGNIHFSKSGSQDGITTPTFQNGQNISAQNAYLMVNLGVGGHFDLLGK